MLGYDGWYSGSLYKAHRRRMYKKANDGTAGVKMSGAVNSIRLSPSTLRTATQSFSHVDLFTATCCLSIGCQAIRDDRFF